MRNITWVHILVTGGAGFIGANFVHTCLTSCQERVVNVDKLTYAGNLENLAALAENKGHIFVRGDIGDRQLVATLLERHRPRAIVNFAAESHVDRSISAPDDFIQTNLVGTFNLLEETRRYWDGLPANEESTFRFLHVSTDEVYGSLDTTDPAFSETTPYAPNSPYSASKAGSDHLVRAYHHTYGLPTLTTNCSNNYGPYPWPVFPSGPTTVEPSWRCWKRAGPVTCTISVEAAKKPTWKWCIPYVPSWVS